MQKSKISKRHEFKLEKVKEVLKVLSKNDQICFRGGTALSLTYEVIERFSEDIDISIFKGKTKYVEVVKFMIDSISNLKWVTKINHNQSKQIIEVYFENNEPPSSYQTLFADNLIVIEYPQHLRNTNDFSFNKVQPFAKAKFEMNVMSCEHIFADKAAILIEKFSSKRDFNWAIDERASARHIYDVQMLINEKGYSKVDKQYIEKRIFNTILKKVDSTLRGNDYNIVTNRKKFFSLSQKNAFNSFKQELIYKKDAIDNKIKLLVYPGAKKFNVSKLLIKYQNIFYFIFKTIKSNMAK